MGKGNRESGRAWGKPFGIISIVQDGLQGHRCEWHSYQAAIVLSTFLSDIVRKNDKMVGVLALQNKLPNDYGRLKTPASGISIAKDTIKAARGMALDPA
jgi:hypothetical protein